MAKPYALTLPWQQQQQQDEGVGCCSNEQTGPYAGRSHNVWLKHTLFKHMRKRGKHNIQQGLGGVVLLQRLVTPCNTSRVFSPAAPLSTYLVPQRF